MASQDVIGAAETGSGKTLAFGLPILQRLLEEREKVERLMIEEGEANGRISPQGYLRALIVTPTRELALQVLITALLWCFLRSVLNSFFCSGRSCVSLHSDP